MPQKSDLRVKFRNWHYDSPACASCAGSRMKPKFVGSLDSEGRIYLEKVGEEDIYSYIQSHAVSCDINNVIARFSAGDVNALNRVQGVFADISGLPNNMADYLNKINRAQEKFDAAPADFKSKFNNDFYQFICQVTNDDFLVPSPQVVEKAVQKVVNDQKEVNEDESQQ